jgi:hypothetical protein
LAYYFANSRNLATIALHARLGFDCGAVPRAGADVHELSQRAYQKVAYRQSPDGWLAELPAIATDLERLRLPADPVVLGCANVEKPENLGAMLRTVARRARGFRAPENTSPTCASAYPCSAE